MAVTVTSRPATVEVSLARWLAAANLIALWSALLLLLGYPLLMVIAAGFAPPLLNDPPLEYAEIFSARLVTAWFNTLRLGLAVSLLAVFMGGVAAILAAQTKRDRWIDLLMSVPFLTPPFLASVAWSFAVGTRGYFSRFGFPGGLLEQALFSLGGMSVLMAVHYAPIVYFATRAQIGQIPLSLFSAAQISGARPARIIREILLPMLAPALLAGGFLAFASGIEEYGTPLIIGNRIGYPVIATEIGRLVSVYPINLRLACALASALLALAGTVYLASHLLQRDARASTRSGARAAPDLLPVAIRVALWIFIAVYAAVAIAIPYGSMLLTSFLKLMSVGPALENLTFENYTQIFTADASALRDALTTSFWLALVAAALDTILGAGCARVGGTLAILAVIPVATPAITMAVGFIRGWNAPWFAWVPVYGSALLLTLFYTAQFLPYAVQYARAGLRTIPSSYEWAARVHGASSGRTVLRIVLPLLWPHCLAGAILIFSIAFRELVGSVLLRPPAVQTVSTFILREFDQGSPAAGMAMGVISVFSALLSITLARRLARCA
jgi:iron(III) transport system permease protein